MDTPISELLGAPKVTETRQGEDTYPRVIRQEDHGDGWVTVTFALPGLRRARVRMPYAEWVAGNHAGIHSALMGQLSRIP